MVTEDDRGSLAVIGSFLNVKLMGILLASAVAAVFGSYHVGYKKGHDAGFVESETICKVEQQRVAISVLTYDKNRLQSVLESSRAIDESVARSVEAATKLEKKIGALRDKAKFTSDLAACRLTDDELQNLRAAYQVRASAGKGSD